MKYTLMNFKLLVLIYLCIIYFVSLRDVETGTPLLLSLNKLAPNCGARSTHGKTR